MVIPKIIRTSFHYSLFAFIKKLSPEISSPCVKAGYPVLTKEPILIVGRVVILVEGLSMVNEVYFQRHHVWLLACILVFLHLQRSYLRRRCLGG
jgi:hypothetical protein